MAAMKLLLLLASTAGLRVANRLPAALHAGPSLRPAPVHAEGCRAARSNEARLSSPLCMVADLQNPVLAADSEPVGTVLVVKETPLRSFAKAAGWRFTASLVTAASSYIFTGSLALAASIVGWDLISKSAVMFFAERLWNNVRWGKSKDGDSSQRSLVKALMWRVVAALNTLFAAAVLTKGASGVARKIAGSDTIVKTFLFFFYERLWAVIAWGKVITQEPAEA